MAYLGGNTVNTVDLASCVGLYMFLCTTHVLYNSDILYLKDTSGYDHLAASDR